MKLFSEGYNNSIDSESLYDSEDSSLSIHHM